MKRCRHCCQLRAPRSFFKSEPRYCKRCLHDRQKAYRKRNASRHAERIRQWRAKNPERAREIAIKSEAKRVRDRMKLMQYEENRRARKRAQWIEDVNPAVLYQRDEGICGICDKPVDASEFQVDHVFPLSKGGLHSYQNTQIAHPRCNQVKGARTELAFQGGTAHPVDQFQLTR